MKELYNEDLANIFKKEILNESIFGKDDIQYEVGKTYEYNYMNNPLKVKFIGVRKNRKDMDTNSEMGDALTDKPVLVFKWLDGEGVPSSHGKKGDTVALGRKEAKKTIKEIND